MLLVGTVHQVSNGGEEHIQDGCHRTNCSASVCALRSDFACL